MSPTAQAPPRLLSYPATFAAAIAALLLFQAASSALTPLFVVYQRLWGFSAATGTLIFAVYVLALLATLLTAGSLSDRRGRKPVLLAALALEAVALALFLAAGDVAVLVAARALQGVATGMALPVLGALLVDVERTPGRAGRAAGVVPLAGLAVGSLACGALVQYAPDPTRLVWALLVGATVLALVGTLALPETAQRTGSTWAVLVPRLRVPLGVRADVLPLVPITVAAWALGGLYLALGPSAAASVFGITDHFVGGLVATLLCGAGAITAVALRRPRLSAMRRWSAVLLTLGTVATLAGLGAGSVGAAVVGTALAGIGYGTSGLATFGTVATLAGPLSPDERSGLFAAAYTVAYLSFSLPTMAAGYVTTVLGLRTTLLGYATFVILIGLAALAAELRRKGGRA